MQLKQILKSIRNVFLSVLAALLILLASLSALMETETGSRWLVTRVADIAGIKLHGISGNLRRGLDVEALEYRTGQQAYSAQQLSFRWRPVDLLYGALVIQSLRAQSVIIQPPPAAPSQQSQQSFKWPTLSLPIIINLQQMRIDNIELVRGKNRQRWQALRGSLSWGQFSISYTGLALMHEAYNVYLTGDTETTFPYATQANLQWQWQPVTPVNTTLASATDVKPALAYIGVSDISGDLKNLDITTRASAPIIMDADVSVALVNNNNELQAEPLLQLRARWQQQLLPSAWWIPDQAVPVTNGELNAQGNWKNYKAELQGDIHLPHAPLLGVSAAVEGDLEKIRIDFLRLRERYISTTADIVMQSPANSSVAVSSMPATTIVSQANSSISAITPQVVDTDAGLTLQGEVHWFPQLDWQIAAHAEHLNFASLFENWPSNINATFSTHGARRDKGWDIRLQNLAIDGDMRGVNVRGSGNLGYDGNQLRTDGLHVVYGANQLRLKGELGKRYNLDWDLNAPMLGQIDNSLQGSVLTQGKLRGNLQQPQVDIEAVIQQFSWSGYAVDKLQLTLAPEQKLATPGKNENENPAVDSTAGNLPSVPSATLVETIRKDNYTLDFSASQLRISGNRFSTITVNGEGSINQHQLQAVIKHTGYGRMDLTLGGKYGDGEWRGQFKHLAIKLKKVPRWWLTASKPIVVDAGVVSIGRQCFTTRTNLTGQVEKIAAVEQEQVIGEWTSNQSYAERNYNWLVPASTLASNPVEKYSLPQLCIDGEWVKTTGARLNANLDSVPLRQFLSLFKTEVYFAGVMDGSLHVQSEKLSLATTKANANITTRNAELRYQYTGGTTEVYAWSNFFVRATLDGANFKADAGMDWTGYGTISATSQLDLQQQKINDGKLTARFSNLAPLETLLPFANDVKGDLRADLSLGGTFTRPQLVGDISLHNGAANLPRLGVDLSNVEIKLNSSESGNINLVSQMQSGEGRLSIVSDLRGAGTPDWTLLGFINGSNFQVIALSQLKATLSPDIKVTANRDLLELTGSAIIPWARTNFKSLPESATAVSPDAVVIDEEFQQGAADAPIQIHTNLDLAFGEDVRFKGFGLNSKLTGKIKLLKEAQRQFFTSGYVSVVDGTYKAYGQTLTIDRGRLLFQGPYENPGLEIRASRIIRDEDNTKVGLDISGTLQRPKATVFSSESLSDSQAMMMLLTGKPISDASKADASLLVSAMSGLGMDSGGGITSEITRFFGVDQLEIKSDQGFDQSELWVGKYLTPRLLVRYIVGIFDQAFGFGVEYQLTDRLRLEAESGETQSVDVVYKIER
jgi:translocation and assembly module TamB